jgi:hypothetical protein
LAALHYNENRARETARTREGTKRYAVEYPKYKMGGYIVRPLVIKCTYDYVSELFDSLLKAVNRQTSIETAPISCPPPLCSSYVHPVKSQAVKEHQSRFAMYGQ